MSLSSNLALAPATASTPLDHAWHWLTHTAWPLWLDHGVDWAQRGFHEHLLPATLTCTADFRRLRVLTRQIYTFSQAAQEGVPRALAAVTLGIERLRQARQADGGYPWRFNLAHEPVDQTRDLYDHAFVLLALTQAAKVLGPGYFDTLKADALALLAYLEREFRHPAGGYAEAIPAQLPRRQNPHMHLLEALLAAAEVFQAEPFGDAANALVGLFFSRIYQADDGLIPEFFDEQLGVLREAGRYVVEPGHLHEWVWLLDSWCRLSGRTGWPGHADCALTIARMQAFCDRFANHPASGRVVDACWSDGTVAQAGIRLWPQTERIKSDFRRAAGGQAAGMAAVGQFLTLTQGVPAGLWVERDGAGPDQAVPASSLYHITAALLDARRWVALPQLTPTHSL